jgi:hypothetical protein
MLFGLTVSDSVPPLIMGIKVYPLTPGSYFKQVTLGGKVIQAVFGKNLILPVRKINGRYELVNVGLLEAYGQIGFAIQTEDFVDSSYNRMGVYSIELCANDNRLYFHDMEELDFNMKRYIYAHTDYAQRMKSNRWFQRSFTLPNDSFFASENMKTNGGLNITAGGEFTLSYYVNDYLGNQSTLVFKVRGSSEEGLKIESAPQQNYNATLFYNRPNVYTTSNFNLLVPAFALYQDEKVLVKEAAKRLKTYSSVWQVGSPYVALYNPMQISILPDGLPAELEEKACIVSLLYGYIGGKWDNGWITASSKYFGSFYVTTDTKPPSIVPLNISNGRDMSTKAGIYFKISDDLSGIEKYSGYIDGKWVLFHYSMKERLIYYLFDEYCPPGRHSLKMVVTDRKNNQQELNLSFSR